MKTFLNKLYKTYNQLRGFFPEPIPVGLTEFQAWIDAFRNTYDLPTQDRDSVAFILSTMIMHLGPTAAYRSKFSFLLALRASASKQVAGATFQEIKLRHLELTKKPTEATVTSDVASNDQKH